MRGGTEQIRTAVGAFAELCLATRPRYPKSILHTFESHAKIRVFRSNTNWITPYNHAKDRRIGIDIE